MADYAKVSHVLDWLVWGGRQGEKTLRADRGGQDLRIVVAHEANGTASKIAPCSHKSCTATPRQLFFSCLQLGQHIHDAQSTYPQKDQRCQDHEFGFEVSSMEYTQSQIPYLTNAEKWAATYRVLKNPYPCTFSVLLELAQLPPTVFSLSLLTGMAHVCGKWDRIRQSVKGLGL